MKIFYIVIFAQLSFLSLKAQNIFKGRVLSSEGNTPLSGVYIVQKEGKLLAETDSTGFFQFGNPGSTLEVTFSRMGLVPQKKTLLGNSDLIIVRMNLADNELNEIVVSTGYQKIPKERATGSFSYIDKELLDRSVSTDIINRLEGIVGSLQFERRSLGNTTNRKGYSNLRIRGTATMNAESEPLIILDNFPFEGDINSINPNDIEGVTILKDAAATSIWGAKAGNGVIVITTRSGKYNSPASVSFSTNVTVQPKPDLYYSDRFLESPGFIEVEKFLYDSKFFQNNINSASYTALTPAVEMWSKYDKGLISKEELEARLAVFRNTDLRREAEKYLYRNTLKTQYSLRSTGGGQNYKYFVSGGYDKNLEEVIGNNFERYSVNFSNHFMPFRFLELHAGVAYTRSNLERNGVGLFDLRGERYPYAALRDDAGNALSIPYNHSLSFAQNAVTAGLLDWEYKPLEDRDYRDNTTSTSEFRINLGARIDLYKGLALDLKYYSQRTNTVASELSYKESYKVRDLVNRYTQANKTRVIPYNDILKVINDDALSNSFRGQVSYNGHFNDSKVDFISGLEFREYTASTSGFELYGYDKDLLTYNNMIDYATVYPTRPLGSSRVPIPDFQTGKLIDRFYSSYANASYDLKSKYILSGSLRWDASNLFGVKTNQKGVPLWSTGLLWKLKEERFIKSDKVDRLDFRVTVGQSGNLIRSTSALPIARYQTEALTGLPKAVVRNPGNPQLRWEKITTTNIGLDFALFNKKIRGSLEYYLKKSTDLLGSPLVDPTVGYKTDESLMIYMVNYAGLKSHGVDFEIYTLNTRGVLRWETVWLTGYVQNKVTRYEKGPIGSVVLTHTSNLSPVPILNKPLDAIYSIPWQGLNPQNGAPMIYADGKPSENFAAYFNSLTLDDLVYSGVTVPPLFGSIRNNLSYKGLSLSVNLMWKAGYVFRRSSVNYYDLYSAGRGHQDFNRRWVNPGDELYTNVPSMPTGLNNYRDYLYTQSEALVEKGDHIRIQDINVSYDIKRTFKVFLYANNLGIIWKKSKSSMDPDYPSAMVLPNKSVSAGLKIDLN